MLRHQIAGKSFDLGNYQFKATSISASEPFPKKGSCD